MKELTMELHSVQGNVPEWIHILPSGTFSGDDGRGPYHVSDPEKLIAASLPTGGRPLPVDYAHGTVLGARDGAAAGWITALQARDDGIWAKVEWTKAGRQAVASREYRFISPMLRADGVKNLSGDVTLLSGAGLTNAPNLSQILALNEVERGGAVGAVLQRMQADMDALALMTRRTPDQDENSLDAEQAALDARIKEALGLLPTTPTKQG